MKKTEKITTAFMLNNDLNQVTTSFEKVYKLAERHQEEQHDWSFCKLDMSQIYHLLHALKTVRKKVVTAFNTSQQTKTPEDQKKQITALNKALYFPED